MLERLVYCQYLQGSVPSKLALIRVLGGMLFSLSTIMQNLKKDEHKSLQKFSNVGASWFLTPHLSAWPYLVGLDMEVDSKQLGDCDFFSFPPECLSCLKRDIE